jgi:hypothetical protein
VLWFLMLLLLSGALLLVDGASLVALARYEAASDDETTGLTGAIVTITMEAEPVLVYHLCVDLLLLVTIGLYALVVNQNHALPLRLRYPLYQSLYSAANFFAPLKADPVEL